MAANEGNPITCGNCGTKNPPDEDFCGNCGEPLNRSAAEGLTEQQEAQQEGGVYGHLEDDTGWDRANADGIASPRTPHRGS